jgi:hypothetical protein
MHGAISGDYKAEIRVQNSKDVSPLSWPTLLPSTTYLSMKPDSEDPLGMRESMSGFLGLSTSFREIPYTYNIDNAKGPKDQVQ